MRKGMIREIIKDLAWLIAYFPFGGPGFHTPLVPFTLLEGCRRPFLSGSLYFLENFFVFVFICDRFNYSKSRIFNRMLSLLWSVSIAPIFFICSQSGHFKWFEYPYYSLHDQTPSILTSRVKKIEPSPFFSFFVGVRYSCHFFSIRQNLRGPKISSYPPCKN